MRYLSRKLKNKRYLFFVTAFILFQFTNCSPIFVKKDINTFDLLRNESNFQHISSLNVRSNILISSSENDGKLYASFDYVTPDSLYIQFRDPLGRKQAFMKFEAENFELWLQRENKRFDRDEIPEDFSLFVFNELELSDIRKLFLGRPLFNISSLKRKEIKNNTSFFEKKGIKISTYFNADKTIRRVEISKDEDISTVIVYSDWKKINDIFFPENIQIIDLDGNIELKIKLYHFSPEYFNLSLL